MLYPLTFKPIFKERIWGGRKLETLYGKKLPANKSIGESWEISDRPGDVSVVANGSLAGTNLHDLLAKDAGSILGKASSLGGRFPLLVKILDAQETLSVQVHPPARQAPALRGEPKTEMWYVANAEPGAELFVGLKKGVTREEFERQLRLGTVADCLHRIPVVTGASMFLPSGRVHALGAGTVIFEIQQNSDTTYRVFDWNRVDAEGKARALHVESSLASIDFHDFEPQLAPDPPGTMQGAGMRPLVQDPLFSVALYRLGVDQTMDVKFDSCVILSQLEGALSIAHAGVVLKPGEFALLPAAIKNARLKAEADCAFLLAEPGS